MPKYTGKYFAYTDLWWGSVKFLNIAEEQQKGGLAYYSSMAVNVFSAFCLEAYLNDIGPHYFKTWGNSREENGEGWKTPKEKVKLLSEKLGFPVDFGRRPFQTFIEIFDYRKLAAHAETIYFDGEFTGESPDLESDLTKKATPITARRFHDDTGEIIRLIHSYYQPGQEPFFDIGEASWIDD